jgi:hypothetical protein
LIGEAQDNHGGPSLAADRSGYLHIVYYPHHGAIRYRRSTRPNDSSSWEPETRFGEGLTYPSLLCGPDGTLVLTARRGYYDEHGKQTPGKNIELEMWTKPPAGEWQRRATLIRALHPGYAQFAASIAWGSDQQTLHLACRIYQGTPFQKAPESFTIGYMVSRDGGVSWTRANGDAITLPATSDTIDCLARERDSEGPFLHIGGLAVDAGNTPYVLYSSTFRGRSALYLASPAPGLGWTRRDLTRDLPTEWAGAGIYLNMGGGISFSASGRLTAVAVVHRFAAGETPDPLKAWGHPSSRVVRLWSDDRLRSFSSETLAPIAPELPHWLVAIEHATGGNVVGDEPGIIYTAGGAGKGLKDLDLDTRVVWRTRN